MNKQKFFKVIDLIDEDIVREAEIKTEALTDAENEKAMTVSGVEKYRKITWQRTAAIASAGAWAWRWRSRGSRQSQAPDCRRRARPHSRRAR